MSAHESFSRSQRHRESTSPQPRRQLSRTSSSAISVSAADGDGGENADNKTGSVSDKRLSRGKSFDLAKWRRRSVRFVRTVVGDIAERKVIEEDALRTNSSRRTASQLNLCESFVCFFLLLSQTQSFCTVIPIMTGISKVMADSSNTNTFMRKISTPSANAAAAARARQYIALHNRQTSREQRLRRQFVLREQNQNRSVSFSDPSTATTSADPRQTISGPTVTSAAHSDASSDDGGTEIAKGSLIGQCWRECWSLLTDIARDSEADELEHWPKRHPPPTLDHLAQTTTFTVREIKTLYRGFKQECPTGVVDEPTFMRIFQSFFPYGEAGSYAHYVFRLLDRNVCTGIISFEQFLRGLERMSRGTLESRLEWVFDLYDIEQRGYLTRYDVWRITHAVYDLVGKHARCPGTAGAVGASTARTSSLLPRLARKSSASVHMVDEVLRKRSSLAYVHSVSGAASGVQGGGNTSSEDHVDRIFDKLDLNQDGLVTKQEFLAACLRDEMMCASLAVLDTFI